MSQIIRQGSHSDSQLEKDGFKQFPRKKQLVMVRELSINEAPMAIKTRWGETLIAQAGYMICYDTGHHYFSNPNEYEHWPVEAAIFEKTYDKWDEDSVPTKAQQQLANMGYAPYYKSMGIWAKSLEEAVYIQSMEHKRPVLVPEKRILAIGAEGEPYHMGDETFHDRYDGQLTKQPTAMKKLVNRLVNFFRRE